MAGVDSIQEVIDRQEQQRIIAERAEYLVRQKAVYKRGYDDGYAQAVEEYDPGDHAFHTAVIGFVVGLALGALIVAAFVLRGGI